MHIFCSAFTLGPPGRLCSGLNPTLMGMEQGGVLCHFPLGLTCVSSAPHAQPLPMENHPLLVPNSTMLGTHPAWQTDLCLLITVKRGLSAPRGPGRSENWRKDLKAWCSLVGLGSCCLRSHGSQLLSKSELQLCRAGAFAHLWSA